MAENIKYGFGKYIWIIGAISLLGSLSLFEFLITIGLEIECEDKVCEQGKECTIDCSIYNPSYKRSRYIFNHGNWPITFTPEIEEFKLYAKYYGKWRFTNFTRATRFTNIPDKALYVFVFPRRTTKYFQIRVVLNSTEKIKWDFGKLDPVIVGYKYIYKNLSEQVSVYREDLVEVKESCFINITTSSIQCTPEYNYTTKTLTGYKTEYYQKKESILDRVGVEIDGKIKEGWYSVCGNYLVEHSFNPGDRNEDEFCRCRPYTLQKGVCKEIDLLK